MSQQQTSAPRRFDGPATIPVDSDGWWEVERARLIRERVAALTRPGAIVADVGCGRGVMLADGPPDGCIVVNVDSHRWENWERRPGVQYVVADADVLPFRGGAFDVVASFDVLEHLADDHAGLREQVRVVKPGGLVVSAVPADPRLWSIHDEAVGHHRRYDAGSYARLARSSGLSISYSTHFFSFLWLPALLTRRRSQRTSEPGNGAGLVSRMARRCVGLCCAVERWLLRRWSLPIGTSLWFESSPSAAQERPR